MAEHDKSTGDRSEDRSGDRPDAGTVGSDGTHEPPPLSNIRVKGPSPRGLNKPAIVIAVGGGGALVLVLALGALSPSRGAVPSKPMMSDPARPEMAQAAVRKLPASYDQTPAAKIAAAPAVTPVLGLPLAGDVPAPALKENEGGSVSGAAAPGGRPPHAAGASGPSEAETAERSGLFFALREAPIKAAAVTGGGGPSGIVSRNPLTALGPASSPASGPASSIVGAPIADRTLYPGAILTASLETAIDSEAPGPVVAQMTEAVYDSARGRTLLIPQGARLLGETKSAVRFGQARLAILWTRLVMPDGAEIALNEPALSPSGEGGVAGVVDNHWGEVFGAAALGTLINVGAAAAEDRSQLTVNLGGVAATSQDPVEAALREGVQRSASLVTSRVVDRSLAVPPTIKIAAATRIKVIVTRRTIIPATGSSTTSMAVGGDAPF